MGLEATEELAGKELEEKGAKTLRETFNSTTTS